MKSMHALATILLTTATTVTAAQMQADTADARVSAQATAAPVDGGFQAGWSVGNSTYSAGGPNGNGQGGESWYDAIVIPFQLPQLGNVADPFTAANFRIVGSGGENGFAYYGLDLYGLGRRDSSEVLGGDFYLGTNDSTDATILQETFRYIGDNGGANGTVYQTNTAADTNLVNYLNDQYAGGAGAGDYVFLRLNVRGTNIFYKYFNFHSADAQIEANRPVIEYTAVPEPAAASIVALGIAAMSRRRRG
jgi:hypothetical protein